jgi:hypothetical protein
MSLVIEIRREPTCRVTLRPYPRWRIAVTFAAIAIVSAVLGLASAPDSVVGRALRVLMVLVVPIMTYGALLACAWYRFRREIITATGATLSIEHRIFRRGRKVKTYAADRVQNVRAVGLGQVMLRGRPVSAIASALAFDYEGQNIRFGAGLVGAEAESVVAAIKDGMSRSTARASRG